MFEQRILYYTSPGRVTSTFLLVIPTLANSKSGSVEGLATDTMIKNLPPNFQQVAWVNVIAGGSCSDMSLYLV
jgi:hypothetical protein